MTLIRWIKGAAWFKFKHALLLFLQRVFSVWGEETSLCPTLLPTCCLTYICSWEACSSRNSVFAVVSVRALQAQVWFWFMNLKASVGYFCVRKEKLKVHSLVLQSQCCLLLCRPEDTWTTCSDDYSVSRFFYYFIFFIFHWALWSPVKFIIINKKLHAQPALALVHQISQTAFYLNVHTFYDLDLSVLCSGSGGSTVTSLPSFYPHIVVSIFSLKLKWSLCLWCTDGDLNLMIVLSPNTLTIILLLQIQELRKTASLNMINILVYWIRFWKEKVELKHGNFKQS